MRRRSNKSAKVPNVKLRPAEKGYVPRPALETCWAEETQPGSDDTTMLDLCPRPFKGVLICATGVQDKPTLFKQAIELGATSTFAFTDLVTHLVASEHGGAKYTCALERKIPILKPSWITENYQIWLRGDDVDLAKSVQDHRLPLFSGVVVCPSGITDITRRTKISQLIEKHDGSYLKQLERPVRVTHLLCSGDVETDKMTLAEKFNNRGEANIHLVWEEWFWDSLEFGGRFSEAKYQVRQPRPERKSLPETSTPPPPSSDVGSQHDEIPSSSPGSKDPQNNAEEAEDEPAFVNVLPDVKVQLWGNLLERRGYEITNGEVLLSPSKVKGQTGQTRKHFPPSSPVRSNIPAGASVISSFRRTNSFAPVVQSKDAGPSRQLPFRRTMTAAAALGESAKAGPSVIETAAPRNAEGSKSRSEAPSSPARPSKIFAGMTFRALGEAKGPAVRGAIEQLGGRMSTDEDEGVTFTIVRLVSGSKIFCLEDDDTVKSKYRTECWLEYCIFAERVCHPDEQISFVPLSIPTPVKGAEQVVMSLSGFDQSESCSLKRLLRALGITLATTFSRRSSHLLCPSGAGLKFEKASEWGVPVINTKWLQAMASSGKIPAVHGYLVPGSIVPPHPDGDAMEIDRRDLKGKGKAVDKITTHAASADKGVHMDVDETGRMNDITNGILGDESLESNLPGKKPRPTIERQATIIDNPEPNSRKGSMFGQPSEILGRVTSSFLEHIHYSSIPDSTSSAKSFGSMPKDASSTDESAPGIVRPESGLVGRSPSGSGSRQRKTSSIEQEDALPSQTQEDRVPSSRTPSPMKAPVRKTSSMRLSLSPVKIDHVATKALQESITSLLGKRPSPDTDEPGDLVKGKQGHGQGGRTGKRARPQRSKAQSRQTSDAKIGEPSRPSPKPRTRSGKTNTPSPVEPAYAGYSIGDFESYPHELNLGDQESQAESMRVMYEDPGQREEKKRLMSLLKSQGGEGESMTLSASRDVEKQARRSTRIAGF